MIYILAGFLGFVAGMLVNYLADVLPVERRLAQPVCAVCGAHFAWKDYLLLSACRACSAQRSWRTSLCLVGGVGISLLLWLSPPARLGYGFGLVLAMFFGLVSVIDMEHRLILWPVSLAGAVLGLICGVLRSDLFSALLGGAVGFAVMLILYRVGSLFMKKQAPRLGINPKEEALGFGDVTISGVLGLMLGFPLVLRGLFAGMLLAGLFSLLFLLSLALRKKFQPDALGRSIPYGPFLVLGAVAYIFLR